VFAPKACLMSERRTANLAGLSATAAASTSGQRGGLSARVSPLYRAHHRKGSRHAGEAAAITKTMIGINRCVSPVARNSHSTATNTHVPDHIKGRSGRRAGKSGSGRDVISVR
jgi:hypothetical protein